MNLQALYQPTPPWILIHAASAEQERWIPSFLYRKESAESIIRVARGSKMRSYQRLMDELGAALQFSESFGENWPALEECLCYMDEWLEGEAYILVITCPLELLIDEEENELETFIRILNTVGEWWSHPVAGNGRFNRGAIPFHSVLRCEEKDLVAAQERFKGVPRL